ncbi:MAG: C25 family cysteine peptidase [Bacteroidales bacterium]|nr:C25 family cysteine peptidase [Bacteroidales bacterium]
MKIFTRCKYLLLLVLSGVLVFPVIAQRVVLENTDETMLTVVSQDVTHLEMRNTIAEFDYKTLNTEGGLFTAFYSHVNAFTGKTGEPRIPIIRKLIEVPLGAELSVEGMTFTEEILNLGEMGIIYPILPVQLPVPKNGEDAPPFQYNEKAYQTDRFYGEKLVTIEEKGIQRGQRLALVTIAPYQYNPVSNQLKIFSDVQFRITFKDGDMPATRALKAKTWSPYFEADYTQALNARAFASTKDPLSTYPITYVIVSDPMFQDQLQPFIAWKAKKGFTVIEGYTNNPEVGNTTSSIKAFIQNLYENPEPGYTPPSFVLFVGDVQQIPAFSGTAGSHVTDLYYCEYTGDDFAEIYFGRFSAQTTAQLQPQIDKTLMIEQYTMPDPSYLNEVVLVSGMDGSHGYNWGNGQINYGTINYFNEAHGITPHTFLYPNSGSNASVIKQMISDGVAYANYTAHCSSNGWADPSFTVGDVSNLTNENMYYLSVGNCCESNAFDASECFGEALLRAEGKGAIGHIGGTNSTYWDEDYYWGVGVGTIMENPPAYEETTLGAYDCLFHDHGEDFADWCATTGQMIFAGNRAVTEGSSMSTYYWEIYSVMGDPSLAMYLAVPEPLEVSYDALMPLGSDTFTITTEPYAYVAISREGELFGAALADESGIAVVTMDPPIAVPGPADVVVTQQFRQPYIDEVLVASPEGPYVLLGSFEVDDSQGNNNGMADYNETILLNIALSNLGNSDATNVTGTLTTADEDITLLQDTYTFGPIAAQGSVTENGVYEFQIAPVIDDNKKVEFNLEITDGSEVWNSKITITLHAPILEIGNLSINDQTGGNGNGRLDAGETADIAFTVLNVGSADISAVENLLSSSSVEVTINNGSAVFSQLLAGAAQQANFNISIDEGVTVGTIVELHLLTSAAGYMTEKTFLPKIGLILEDFETGDFSAFNWTQGQYPWSVVAGGASGDFSAQSGDISDEQTSELKLAVEVLADDTIKFFAKVSSEATYDYLRFYIDGQKKDEWSGDNGWTEAQYPVSTGIHELKWTYEKDYSVSNGSDCGWIDYIVFPAISDYVGVREMTALIDADLSVYPNPFNNKTRIAYVLNNPSDVSLVVYNAMGECVQVIENVTYRQPGIYMHEFDASELQYGMYFCVFKSLGKSITKKLIISE